MHVAIATLVGPSLTRRVVKDTANHQVWSIEAIAIQFLLKCSAGDRSRPSGFRKYVR